MGKNRAFHNKYEITIQGKTTNGFQAKLFDDALHAFCTAIGVNSQQCSVSINPAETFGDYDTKERKLKEEGDK